MGAYTRPVPIEREELARRLAEADRVRAQLRQVTREWRAVGDHVLEERKGGPPRPDQRSPRRR
jgi:hypothetical protein